ncbi:MAG: hypothetical protein OSB69_19725, partial [Alphaproteobacteria bacterium]|nr:hypothetical protein [Alphaproteobacteria bacterium]
MTTARIIWLASILGALSLAGILIAWPGIRGLCASCAPTSVTGIPSNQFVRVQHAADIDDVFAKQLGGDPFLGDIPRVFVQALPSDLGGIVDVERRKRLFLQILLPQTLRLNEGIRADRARLIAISQTPPEGQSTENAAWLARVAQEYRVDPTDYASLLARVDVVPPSLAIAQG